VWATDVDESALERSAEMRDRIRTHPMKVRDSAAIKKAGAEIGVVDVLFNCASYVHDGTILDTPEKDWDFSFDLNVKSMYRTSLPGILQSGRGNIINVASVVSSVKGRRTGLFMAQQRLPSSV
jgi:2-keto-3-deoxy-L-fuconate dehydrogenase